MNPRLLPALLLLGLPCPASLRAAPGEVYGILQKIVDGSGGISLADYDSFGNACAVLGDLDGDGVPELAVGASGDNVDRGAVHLLFLDADGAVKSTAKIAHSTGGGPALDIGDHFGMSCAALGDLDGDGVPELAVGASGDDGGRGAVHLLFLNADGAVKSTAKIADGRGGLVLASTDSFGISCAALGDLDGDGVPELAVGTAGANGNRGAVHLLFLEANGTVKSIAKIDHLTNNGPSLASNDFFGMSCAALGDLNGDGVPELAVGAFGDDTGGDSRGAVHLLFLDADGSVKSTARIADGDGGLSLANRDFFGTSCAALGDLNGDGVPELAVGADGDDTGDTERGAVHLLFLDADGSVKSTTRIAHGSGALSLANHDFFGRSCVALGDLNGDGVPELAVGANGDDTGDVERGAIHLISLGDPPLTVTTLDDPLSGMGLSLRDAIGEAHATGEFCTIRFDPSLDGGTIELSGELLIDSQALRITGEGLANGLTLSGKGLSRVLSLVDATLALDSLTVRNGSAAGGAGIRVDGTSRLVLERVTVADCVDTSATGGGVFNQGSLKVVDCAFLGNRSVAGGAILNSGGPGTNLSMLNSTFSGNGSPTSLGGAILSPSPAAIRHATFVGNTADEGGAIAAFDATMVALSDSLFAGNVAGTHPDYDADSVTDGGGNSSVGIDQLMPLGDYGGPTATQPLKPTSAAKGAVVHRALPAFDQRGPGFPRTVGPGRDPGAVEAPEISAFFQPDNRIGLKAGKQIGNNRYNANGTGQTVKLTLRGARKAKIFLTVENDGNRADPILLSAPKPKRKSLEGKIFRLTGGRRNVSAQVFRSGLLLAGMPPNATVAFQTEWKGKSRKASQLLTFRSSSRSAAKLDAAGARISTK